MKYACNHQPGTWQTFFQGFFIGLSGLSLFYFFLLIAVTQDIKHPITQFVSFQPWMSLLIVGFGVQMGLFRLMRRGVHINIQDKKDATLTTGTGTAISGAAMVACCAHHAVDILPVVGLSAAALFLSEYQEQLLILGVLANFLGMVMMFWFLTGKAKPALIIIYLSSKLRQAV